VPPIVDRIARRRCGALQEAERAEHEQERAEHEAQQQACAAAEPAGGI
jgi:hypothetical protein